MAKKLITDRERFFRSIKKDGECWVWQLAKDWDGYGLFKIYPIQRRAHRWAYEEFVGNIPNGLQIDHLCCNPACVNPDHLDVVTVRENAHRAWRANKKRCVHGHPLFGDNLYIAPNGTRACKKCRLQKSNDYQKNNPDATKRAQQKYHRRLKRALAMR